MSVESPDGPSQKKPRMVSYPNFRPAGYDPSHATSYQEGALPENEPTPVLHLRMLTPKVVEVDVWDEMGRLGKVNQVFMIKKSGQALVEFDSLETASRILEISRTTPLKLCGSPVQTSYSKSKNIRAPTSKDDVVRAEHNILLLSIHKVMYPITVDVLHTICKPYGEVARIVIFRKGGTQAMVEFHAIADAVKAKKNLNGTFIYKNCCALRVDFAKPDKLLVRFNNQDTWDYTPEGPAGSGKKESEPRVLLPDPVPGAPPGQMPQQQSPQQQQQPQQMPPWGPGWGMNMPGMGPPGMGWGGMGQRSSNDRDENGADKKGVAGNWGPPPPPPAEREESDSNRLAFLQMMSSAAYGYGNPYGSGNAYGSGNKYGTGFPDSYGGGYGGSSHDDYGEQGDGPEPLLPSRGPAGGPQGGQTGYAGYGTQYPPNMAHMGQMQMAMMASQAAAASRAMPGGGSEVPNCVVMFYGLSTVMNCEKLFNLCCLYGNVVRIKFLHTKSDAAMVQMGDQEGCEELISSLNEVQMFGNAIHVSHSKQPFLMVDFHSVKNLPDGTPAAQDFSQSKCNRFMDPKAGGFKRYKPHNLVHYFNAPPGFTDDDMKSAIEQEGAVLPDVIKLLGAKNGKNSSGLMQWVKQSDATEAVAICNHMKLESVIPNVIPGKRPNSYTLKLCFSNVPYIA